MEIWSPIDLGGDKKKKIKTFLIWKKLFKSLIQSLKFSGMKWSIDSQIPSYPFRFLIKVKSWVFGFLLWLQYDWSKMDRCLSFDCMVNALFGTIFNPHLPGDFYGGSTLQWSICRKPDLPKRDGLFSFIIIHIQISPQAGKPELITSLMQTWRNKKVFRTKDSTSL